MPGEAKIQYLHRAARGQHHIPGLQVPVNHAALVRRLRASAIAPQTLSPLECPMPALQTLRQRFSFDQFQN